MVDVLDRDALKGGVRRQDLSGFRAGDRRGGNAVGRFHSHISCLNALLNSCIFRSEAAARKSRRGRGEDAVAIVGARVAQNQAGNRGAVALFRRGPQLSDPAKIGARAHHAAGELHGVELKIAGGEQLRYRPRVQIVTLALD